MLCTRTYQRTGFAHRLAFARLLYDDARPTHKPRRLHGAGDRAFMTESKHSENRESSDSQCGEAGLWQPERGMEDHGGVECLLCGMKLQS